MNERMNEWMREWMNEWRNEWMNEWMNEWKNEEWWLREQQTCYLTIHFKMWTVSSDVSIQRRHWQPLSVHLRAYCIHPTYSVMCVGWPQHRGLRPLLFSNWGVGVSTVRRDLRTHVPRAFPTHFLREKPWGRETEINQCLGGLHTRKILNNSRKA